MTSKLTFCAIVSFPAIMALAIAQFGAFAQTGNPDLVIENADCVNSNCSLCLIKRPNPESNTCYSYIGTGTDSFETCRLSSSGNCSYYSNQSVPDSACGTMTRRFCTNVGSGMCPGCSCQGGEPEEVTAGPFKMCV